MSAAQRVRAARTALVLESPFFGALALRLRLQEDPGSGTAWTDGAAIGFDPAFVDTCTDPELIGLLAHEVLHCASGHPWRRDGREAKRWNVACDYAINGTLAAAGFQLPASALFDPQYTGKPAEWIFDRLPVEPEPDAGGSGAPAPGEVRDAPHPAEGGADESEWRTAVQQAANVAAARGELSGELERFAAAAKAPAVDWRSVLQRFAQDVAKADYSWRRPNARYMPRGLYLPALHSTAMGRLVVAVDVSGSVDAVLLEQFAAELRAIAEDLRPAAVDVLYCDARVQRRESFEPGERIELRACGGGGTDFRPVFAALTGEDPPAALVYLTDLYGPAPEHAPEYPVLWACTSPEPAPWGERVQVM